MPARKPRCNKVMTNYKKYTTLAQEKRRNDSYIVMNELNIRRNLNDDTRWIGDTKLKKNKT